MFEARAATERNDYLKQPYYEVFRDVNELGIQLAYRTTPGGYHPLHWHEELEILYPLENSLYDTTCKAKTTLLMPKTA